MQIPVRVHGVLLTRRVSANLYECLAFANIPQPFLLLLLSPQPIRTKTHFLLSFVKLNLISLI